MSILETLSGNAPGLLSRPDGQRSHVLVIGSGAIGCVTAWELLARGFRVTIVAKDFPSFPKAGQGDRVTSQIGAALWEYPCPPCGPPPSSTTQLQRLRRWAIHSYKVYEKLAGCDSLASHSDSGKEADARRTPAHASSASANCRFGVAMRRSINLYPFSAEAYGPEKERLSALQKDFSHTVPTVDASLANLLTEARNLGSLTAEGSSRTSVLYDKHNNKIVDARCHIAPVIDTDQAMLFLVRLLEWNGVTMVRQDVKGSLEDAQQQLLESFRAHVIVNAAGVGAGTLAKDSSIEPARGALLRYEIRDAAAAQHIPAVVVNNTLRDDHDITYVVPRSERILVVGTFLEHKRPDDEVISGQEGVSRDEPVSLNSRQVIEMRQRAERSIPSLRNLTLSADYPLAQAWRPTRKNDARVEREGRIVHNYGHGVYGWTVAFGCASEAADLVEEALKHSADFSPSKARL